MPNSFLSELITHKPELFRAILRFNAMLDAAPQPAALACAGADGAAALWASPAARRLLNRPAAPDQFWDFAEESRRLALLPQDTLVALARTFGVALHAEAIAGVIDGPHSAALRRDLGDLYDYALARGRYQLGASLAPFRDRDSTLPLAERCLLHGCQALTLIRADWPEALRRKAALPDDWPNPELDTLPRLPPETRRALWFGMKKMLFKEVAPEWAPCFN